MEASVQAGSEPYTFHNATRQAVQHVQCSLPKSQVFFGAYHQLGSKGMAAFTLVHMCGRTAHSVPDLLLGCFCVCMESSPHSVQGMFSGLKGLEKWLKKRCSNELKLRLCCLSSSAVTIHVQPSQLWHCQYCSRRL